MSTNAIDPLSGAFTTGAAAVAHPPAKQSERPPTPVTAPVASPAVKVQITGVPASVKPQDRALYLQILKSVGGNATVALATLLAREASEATR